MADGFTVTQYIELLRIWHNEVLRKEKSLMNGFRVYQTLFFVQTACLNTFNIISTFITSIMIGLAASGETTTLTILSAIATAFGILIGVFNAINFVFKPQSTAVGAASSSKQYGGLAKELIVEIMSYEVMFGGMSQNEVSQFSIPDVGLTTNLKSGSSAALGVSRSMHDPRYEPSPEVEIHINDHHIPYEKKMIRIDPDIIKYNLEDNKIILPLHSRTNRENVLKHIENSLEIYFKINSLTCGTVLN